MNKMIKKIQIICLLVNKYYEDNKLNKNKMK